MDYPIKIGGLKIGWINFCLTTNEKWSNHWKLFCDQEGIQLSVIDQHSQYENTNQLDLILITMDDVDRGATLFLTELKKHVNLPVIYWVSFYSNNDKLALVLAGANDVANKYYLADDMRKELLKSLEKIKMRQIM
jgi:DNA-binding response OmpR family regulator